MRHPIFVRLRGLSTSLYFYSVGRRQGVTHTEVHMHATVHLTDRRRTIRDFDPLLSNAD